MASTGQVGIGHPHIDARSLDMARIVVERIDADPGLFNVAHENLERWRRLHGTLSRANEEWKQLLERPWCEIREILLEESDEGQRLRSTHPFRGIVTEEERLAIIKRHPLPPPPDAILQSATIESPIEQDRTSGPSRGTPLCPVSSGLLDGASEDSD